MSDPAIVISYEESVGSCGPPTPLISPATSAHRGAPVRRQLNFTAGGDLENDDDDDIDDEFLCRVDDIVRGYSEAKQQAPPCICGRGLCKVERDDQSGQWKYVCPSRPKCNHVAFCGEAHLNPESEPITRSHASNPCVFNDPSNHMASPRTPVSVRPQVAGAGILFSDSPQGEKLLVPSTPAKVSPQGAEYNEEQGLSYPPRVEFYNGEPICQCRAGKCQKARIGKQDWYVCPIPKGKGACTYKVLACEVAKDIAPSKSPMRPCVTPSPVSPNSICYGCHEKGHWIRDCPNRKQSKQSPCFNCGMVGHWKRSCPQL